MLHAMLQRDPKSSLARARTGSDAVIRCSSHRRLATLRRSIGTRQKRRLATL